MLGVFKSVSSGGRGGREIKTKRCYMAKKSIFRSLGFADWFVRLDDLKIRGSEKDVVCENALTCRSTWKLLAPRQEKVDLRLPLRGHEGKRNDCFSKIQLVGQKYRDKTTLAS